MKTVSDDRARSGNGFRPPCRILVVDDCCEDRELFRDLLLATADVDVLEAESIGQALEISEQENPDCILLDNRLSGDSGFSFLERVCQEPHVPKFPVVFLTGTGNEDVAVRAIQTGAQDYLVKGRVTGELLYRTIQNAIEKVAMRRQIEEQRNELLRLATTDELTGLSNRRHFIRRLQEEIERAVRYEAPLTLLLIDVDYFKRINDQYGHPTGDDVLARTGELIRQCLRQSDIAARYGGEEFAVVLTNTTADGGLAMANRLQRILKEEPFCSRNGASFQVTCSIGVAELRSAWEDWEQLVSTADHALYRAKHSGRNRVILSEPVETESSALP